MSVCRARSTGTWLGYCTVCCFPVFDARARDGLGQLPDASSTRWPARFAKHAKAARRDGAASSLLTLDLWTNPRHLVYLPRSQLY